MARPRRKPLPPEHPTAFVRVERHADAQNRVDVALYLDPQCAKPLKRHAWWEARPSYMTRVARVDGQQYRIVRVQPIDMGARAR